MRFGSLQFLLPGVGLHHGGLVVLLSLVSFSEITFFLLAPTFLKKQYCEDIELISLQCRKVIGFALLRYTISLKYWRHFFHQTRVLNTRPTDKSHVQAIGLQYYQNKDKQIKTKTNKFNYKPSPVPVVFGYTKLLPS